MGQVGEIDYHDWKLGHVKVTESPRFTVFHIEGRSLYFNKDGSFDGTSIATEREKCCIQAAARSHREINAAVLQARDRCQP